MKIMIISRFKVFPPTFGAARRIYNVIKYLSKNKNNKIIVFSSIIGKDQPKTNLPVSLYAVNLPGFLLFFSPFVLVKIIKIFKKENPNLLLSETLWAGLHCFIMKLLFSAKYILDEHNVEYLRLRRSSYGKFWWPFIKFIERIVCKYANKILCVSNVDKQFLIRMGIEGEKIYVMPNGVSTEIFYPCKSKREKTRKKLGIKPNEKVVLFFGALDYEPNKQAVKVILNDIVPRVNCKTSRARFLIVGRSPKIHMFTHDNVIFTGVVNHVEDYINASDIVICPLKSGGGTRTKILEAIACGKLVISTSIGVEGLPVKELQGNIILSDDWEDFVNKIVNIILNPNSTNINVPRQFLEKYSWEKIISKFEYDILSVFKC
jgi:glycosyltransferase involved in cell wall biosynthesis